MDDFNQLLGIAGHATTLFLTSLLLIANPWKPTHSCGEIIEIIAGEGWEGTTVYYYNNNTIANNFPLVASLLTSARSSPASHLILSHLRNKPNLTGCPRDWRRDEKERSAREELRWVHHMLLYCRHTSLPEEIQDPEVSPHEGATARETDHGHPPNRGHRNCIQSGLSLHGELGVPA